jgi:hypothetical protein
MVTVKPFSMPNGGYAESPIMGHYSFAFLSDDNVQCHQFAKCRETIAERFMYHISGASGYAAYPKPSLEKTRVLIAFTNQPELGKLLEKALVGLHDIEGKLGLVRTTMDQVEGLSPTFGTVYLIEGSKRWQLSPPMFSLFLLILRSQSMDALRFLDGLQGQPSAIKMLNHLVATKYWKVFGKDQMINWNYLKLAATDNNSANIIPYLGVYSFVEGSPGGSHPEAKKVRYAKLFPHWTFIPKEVI